jgi:hypothetical protein
MHNTLRLLLLAMLTFSTLSSCGPLLVGGGAAVIADQVAEDENGGDGLF